MFSEAKSDYCKEDVVTGTKLLCVVVGTAQISMPTSFVRANRIDVAFPAPSLN